MGFEAGMRTVRSGAMLCAFVVVVGLSLALSVALGGCAGPNAKAPSATLYERLGGQPAIVAVVDDAIVNIAADPRINQRFNSDAIPHLRTSLVDLICLRTGGPCKYTGRNMSDAHEGMNIRDDEFDALADDIARSLDKFKVPAREKGELMAALGQMRGAIVGH